MRRLIVNADDFGLTAGINQAVVEAHQRGIVTSTTLMATGRAFQAAVDLSRTVPTLDVGCHIVLVDGQPVARPEQVRGLLAPSKPLGSPFRGGSARRVAVTMSPENRFYDDFGKIAAKGLRGGLRAEQIEAEVVAQIRRLQNFGISVSHVDTHKHTHMLPKVAEAVFRGALACGVKAIRNPFIPLTGSVFKHIVRHPKLWKRYTEISLLRGYNHDFRKRARAAGMVTPEGSFGVVITGAVNEELFRAVVDSIPEGTWEYVCHPGYNDEELRRVKTRLRESREKELSILTSQWAKDILAERKVELISYRELAGAN